MPIQIDRFDTSIEITQPSQPSRGDTRPAPAADPVARDTLADAMSRVLSDELARFLRNRGL